MNGDSDKSRLKYDMTAIEGLRSACHAAEGLLEQEVITRNATFLQEVHETPPTDRESERFLTRVWDDNPLAELANGNYDVSRALADADFRRNFHELTTATLPEGEERAVRLNEILDNVLGLVQPHVPADKNGNHDRPIIKTRRAFAAIFPHDFTTLLYPERLSREMGGRTAGHRNAVINRWILDRLEEALGPVDRSDWNAVAQRMMLPEIVYREFRQQSPSNSAVSAAADPLQPIRPPPLSRIKKYFESLRAEGSWNSMTK